MLYNRKKENMRLANASVLAPIAALSALVMVPYANAQSITNATQLSVNLAPITMSGVKQGGSASISASGLTAAASPTLDATGAFTAAAAPSAPVAGSAFSYAVSGYSADVAAVSTTITGATPLPSTGTYGVQSGSFTSALTGGVIAVDPSTGAASVTAASTVGATVSAVSSTSLSTGSTSTSYQRSASSTNDQSSFSAERQGSSASLSGSGVVTGATLPALATAALGTASAVTSGNASTIDGTINKTVMAGQAGAGLVATSNASVAIPIYGKVTTTFGGTTAGVVGGTTGFTMNTLGVNTTGANAGTSSTLTAVSSFSVFAK
jgi:hypothetical protein